ncbi:MAG TPA: DUF5995 family protein [Solirubrobacteraceae bacterium]|nr:DUF5995 family protein [Solirubrobacteraceae bacterium]
MKLAPLACLAVTLAVLAPGTAAAQAPWLGPGTEHLPPDPSVPYLPAVAPRICTDGAASCFQALEADLLARTNALACDHDAVFSHAYLTITRALIGATNAPGFFRRPDRITHEAKTYAQEYFDQYARWHAGAAAATSPSWQVALRAADEKSVTAMGDLLLQLNAHIRRDNPIRAVEQTDGVLRLPGPMPASSGKPDHEQVSVALANAMDEMMTLLADRYDPTIDDGMELFGLVFDARGLYSLIAAWREESWRNAEQLRHARAVGGTGGLLYQAKLAQIEDSAAAGAQAILAATRTDPGRNAARDAYCAAHV